jgi:hypothetical protein
MTTGRPVQVHIYSILLSLYIFVIPLPTGQSNYSNNQKSDSPYGVLQLVRELMPFSIYQIIGRPDSPIISLYIIVGYIFCISYIFLFTHTLPPQVSGSSSSLYDKNKRLRTRIRYTIFQLIVDKSASHVSTACFEGNQQFV